MKLLQFLEPGDPLRVASADASGTDFKREVDGEISRLAKLGKLEYEHERRDVARRLEVRAPVLDRWVAARRNRGDDRSKQGHALSLPEPTPWPEPVAGPDLLDRLSTIIRRHVVMADHAADTIALWVIHTYLLDCFGISPRLAITSPERGCGKTTLVDILSHLVMRPLPVANATASAVFRIVEIQRPTLLIDEADTFLSESDELRGILNSGHRQGGAVIRAVGENLEPRSFSTYSACAIALIGKLPSTLADRSVLIELRRRRPEEFVEPFRFDRTGPLDQLASQVARWAQDNAACVRAAEPTIPAGVLNRTADNWRPLLAISEVARGEWPVRTRQAVQCFVAAVGEDDHSTGVALLADIRAIFAQRCVDRMRSAELVDALVAIEGRTWAEWKAGKPITANSLARILAPFRIKPGTIRTCDGTPKGYQFGQFEDAISRYLPAEQ
jgi:putative DNA primase/helicase